MITSPDMTQLDSTQLDSADVGSCGHSADQLIGVQLGHVMSSWPYRCKKNSYQIL